MSSNKILDDINALRNNVDVFGQNLSQQISKLEDQIDESERENKTLVEKVTNLSDQIIEQHKIKSQLLVLRHNLLTDTQNNSDLLLITKNTVTGQSSSSQPMDDESQDTIAEPSKLTTEVLVENRGVLQNPEDGKISISAATAKNQKVPVDTPVMVADTEPHWMKLIAEGLEHFNLTRKQTIKTMGQLLPENLNELKLRSKLQVKGLNGQKVSCAAGQNEVIVIVTVENLYAYYFRSQKFVSMKLETTILCVEVQTQDVAIIGSDCGQLSVVSINQEQIEQVHKYPVAVTAVKVHPNRRFAVLSLASGEWSLVDILDRKVLRTQDTKEIISSFDIHPNGVYLATCAYLGSVTFWDLRLPSAIQHVQNKELLGIKTVKFLIHGNWICLRTATTVHLLDTKKFPKGSSNVDVSTGSQLISTSSRPLMDADPSGRIVCCTAGQNIRILTTFRKENGEKLNGLHEVKTFNAVGQVIYFKFVDSGVIFLTDLGEIELYNFYI